MMSSDEIRESLAELLKLSDEELGERMKAILMSWPDAVLGRMARASAEMSNEQLRLDYDRGRLAIHLADKDRAQG